MLTFFQEKAKKALRYWNKQKGKIISAIIEGIVSDKNRPTKSLYLPRFDSERPDRTDADTLKMIQDKIKGNKK